jgi:hypothetical protein
MEDYKIKTGSRDSSIVIDGNVRDKVEKMEKMGHSKLSCSNLYIRYFCFPLLLSHTYVYIGKSTVSIKMHFTLLFFVFSDCLSFYLSVYLSVLLSLSLCVYPVAF